MEEIDYNKIKYPQKMDKNWVIEKDFICYVASIRDEWEETVLKVWITKDLWFRMNTIRNYHKWAKLVWYCDNLNYNKVEERMESHILDFWVQKWVKRLDWEYLKIKKDSPILKEILSLLYCF